MGKALKVLTGWGEERRRLIKKDKAWQGKAIKAANNCVLANLFSRGAKTGRQTPDVGERFSGQAPALGRC